MASVKNPYDIDLPYLHIILRIMEKYEKKQPTTLNTEEDRKVLSASWR